MNQGAFYIRLIKTEDGGYIVDYCSREHERDIQDSRVGVTKVKTFEEAFRRINNFPDSVFYSDLRTHLIAIPDRQEQDRVFGLISVRKRLLEEKVIPREKSPDSLDSQI